MARYICEKCGAKFDEPFREHDDIGGWDSCPDCGNPDFEEAAQCVCCGEDFAFGSLIGGKLCKMCLIGASSMTDYRNFSLKDQPEAFAEYLVELYAERWKKHRLAPFREGRTDG